MKYLVLVAIALLATACAPTVDQLPPGSAPPTDNSQTLSIFLSGNDNFTWDGWNATSKDIPTLVKNYQPQTVIIRGHSGTTVDYNEALQIRYSLLAAGVKNVQIASGGTSGQ